MKRIRGSRGFRRRGEPSATGKARQSPIEGGEVRKRTHVDDLPSARLGVIQLLLNPRKHRNVSNLLDLVLVSNRNLVRLEVAVSEDLLRSPRDDEDVDVVFEDLGGHDLRQRGEGERGEKRGE